MLTFDELFKDCTKQATKIKKADYGETGKYPIIDQGQNNIAGFTDDKTGIFQDVPAIGFGDHTRIVKYIDEPCFLGADGIKLLKCKKNNANYKYLYYMIKNVKIPDTGYNRHFKWLKGEKFVYPNENEQKKTVNVLDRIQGMIQKRKAQLAELDKLAKSRFVELFGDMILNSMGWNESVLESMADIASGITKGRRVKERRLIEVPYMAVSNVKDGYIDWSMVKTIMATEQEVNQYRLYSDDVLMTEGGDPDKVGRGAIIKRPLENCIHQNHIFRVRLDKDRIIPEFFAEYLQHPKAKRYFLGCAKQTTGIASINMRQLRALPVLLPPLDLQNRFAAFVQRIDKSKLRAAV